MVVNINNLGTPLNSGPRGEKAEKSEVANSSERSAADSALAAKTPDGNRVEFSNQANTLQAAEERIQGFPEVDSNRVAEVRAAIEKGEFSIDNQSIADKMLAIDALLE